MKLFPMTPFAADMNLGKAYNECMAILPDDAWACFMDHDMMLTTREWYRQLEEAIAFKPEAGAFVAMTNRIAAPWQRVGERESHDIKRHRDFGTERLKVRTLLDITDTKGWGGVLFALSKATWREVGGFVDGMACVDHCMHFAIQKTGKRIYLVEGLFVYHWRRAFGDNIPANAPIAKNCPCRGHETLPTERVAIPELVRC